MYHGVPPTNSKEARISIAFNVRVEVQSMPRPVQRKPPLAIAFDPTAESPIKRVVLGQSLVFSRSLEHIADAMREVTAPVFSAKCNPVLSLKVAQPNWLTVPPTQGQNGNGKVSVKLSKCSSTAGETRRKLTSVLHSSVKQLVAHLKSRLGPEDNFKRFYMASNLLRARRSQVNKLTLTVQRVEAIEVVAQDGAGPEVYSVPLSIGALNRPKRMERTVFLTAIYLTDVEKGSNERGCNLIFQERRTRLKSWKWALRKSISKFNTMLLPNLYGLGKSELPVSRSGELFILTHPTARQSIVQQLVGRRTKCKWMLIDLKVNY